MARHPAWSARVTPEAIRVEAGPHAVTLRGEGSGAFVAAGPALLQRDLGDAVEEWVDGASALEQRWRFAHAPGRQGDRTFRVGVEGGRCEADGEAGVVFVAEVGAVLRYGHGTFVDADGRRTLVPARCTDDGVSLTLPAELLEAARYPAVLDPTVTPVVLDALPAIHAGIPMGGVFSVADNGRVVLVSHRYVARIDHSGQVLSPAPRIEFPAYDDRTTMPTATEAFLVRRFGDGFLSVWRGAALNREFVTERAMRRLDPDGTPRNEPSVPVDGVGPLDAACDVAGCLLTYAGAAPSFRRVGADGRFVDTAAVRLANTGGATGAAPAVGLAASGWLVAWSDSTAGASNADIRVARVGRDGTVLDPGGRTITTAALQRTTPAVASDGTNFFVAWIARSGFGSQPAGAYGMLLGPTGAALTPTLLLGAGTDTARTAPASVAYDGTRYVVGWARPDSAAIVRVSRAGAVIDTTPLSRPGTPLGVQVVGSNNGEVFVASYAGTVGGHWLRTSGAFDPLVTTLGVYPNAEGTPVVGWNGREFLLHRPDQGINPLYWTILERAPRARFLTEEGVQRSAWFDARRAWAAAYDGTRLHLVGEFGDMVAQNGTITAPPPWPTGTTFPSPRVASGNGAIGVVSVGHTRQGVNAPYVTFRRIDNQGRVLDTSPLSIEGPAGAVGFNGQAWFVFVTQASRVAQLYRISAAGELLAGSPHTLPSGADDAACGGGVCVGVVIGTVTTGGVDGRRAMATMVDGNGNVLRQVELYRSMRGTDPRYLRGGAISFDGREFVVTFQEWVPSRMVAIRLRPDGTLVNPAGEAVFANPWDMLQCTQDASPNGRTLVVCRGWDRGYPTHRLYASLLRADGVTPPDAGVDAGPRDTGVDVGFDTGPRDTGVDVGFDTGPRDTGVDVGFDTGPRDTGVDVAVVVDVGVDAGVDVGVDVGVDAGVEPDAGPPDTGVQEDAGPVVDVSRVDAGRDVGAPRDDGAPPVDVVIPLVDAGDAGDAGDAADAGAALVPPEEGGWCSVGAVGARGRRMPHGAALLAVSLAALSTRRRRGGQGAAL